MMLRTVALGFVVSSLLFVVGCGSDRAGSAGDTDDPSDTDDPETEDTTPPADVTGLAAVPGFEAVALSWTNPTDTDFDHVVLSYEPNGAEASLGGGVTSTTSTDLNNGVEYTFTVQAVDTAGNRSAGVSVKATPTASVPPDVRELQARVRGRDVDLSWVEESAADFLHVSITYTPGDAAPLSVAKGEQKVTVASLACDVTYTFVAKTVDAHGEESAGVSANATVDCTPPSEVQQLVAARDNGFVDLLWENPGDADFDHVLVTYTPNGAAPITVAGGEHTTTILGLTNGVEYTFTVQTVDRAGNASNGTTVKATPMAIPPRPTITGAEEGSFNTTQTLVIEGEPGALIEYSTDGGSTWETYDTPIVLSEDGAYVLVARQVMDGLSSRETSPLAITIDTIAPLAPSLTSPVAGLYNVAQPITVLPAEAGGLIEYSTDNGTSWLTYTGADTLAASGTYAVTARQTDAARNVSEAPTAIVVTLDLDAPAALTLSGAEEGHRYNDDQAITAALVEQGATVEVSYNGGDSWTSCTLPLMLSTGDGTTTPYAVTLRQVDEAGNPSLPSATLNVTIDKEKPATPGMTGISHNAFYNDDPAVTLTGLEANATVEVSPDSGVTWVAYSEPFRTSTAANALAHYDVLARQTDEAGNASTAMSAAVHVTVDKQRPATPGISGITHDASYKDDPTVTLTGIEANATAQVRTSNAGTWTSYTQPYQLSSPADATTTYDVTAHQQDRAGNLSDDATVIHITVDKEKPATPGITGITHDALYKDDPTVTLTGLEAGATVELSQDNGATWIAYSTPYQVSTAANTVASYDVLARQTDKVGNASNAMTTAVHITIDKQKPAAPGITGITHNAVYGSDRTVTLTGVEPNATVEVRTSNSGTWTAYTEPFQLVGSAGVTATYDVTAHQTDLAGNLSDDAVVVHVVLDMEKPAAPSFIGIAAGTYDTAKTFTLGGIEAGATVEYSTDNGASWQSFGTSATLSSNGSYNLKARQKDAVGNMSDEAGPIAVTISIDLPPVTAIGAGQCPATYVLETGLSLTFTANESATFACKLDGATVACTQTPPSTSGSWSASGLLPGTHVFSVCGTDVNGHAETSCPSCTWTILDQGFAAGYHSTCVVKADKTAWCWGQGSRFKIGDGANKDRYVTMQVAGGSTGGFLQNVRGIATGYTHACAVTDDTSVYCWGDNRTLQIGVPQGSIVYQKVPAAVGQGAFSGAVMVTVGSGNETDAGSSHSCALKDDGSVWCWGRNLYGSLGDDSTTQSMTPVQVKGPSGSGFLTNVAYVGAGDAYTCALTRAGAVYCWGKNGQGQLGNGSTAESHVPVLVSGLAAVSQLSVGVAHSCARVASGAVYCWGRNSDGQLGANSTADYLASPTQVVGEGCSGVLTGVHFVAAGGKQTCALRADGSYQCWGGNACCEVAAIGPSANRVCPQPLLETSGVKRIVVGDQHHCVEKSGGELWCRGPNANGENGDYYPSCNASTCATTTLTRVVGAVPLTGAEEVAVGPQHTCVRKSDGAVWCTGSNTKLELGVIPAGPTLPAGTSSLVPFTVARPVYADPSTFFTGSSRVVAGQYHSCALKNGSVYCWGGTDQAQCGNEVSATSLYPAPTQVTNAYLTSITALASGPYHACASKGGAQVWCWGDDTYRQSGSVGNPTFPAAEIMFSPSGPAQVQELSAGFAHTCARGAAAGEVYCWGWGVDGRLGDNDLTMHSPAFPTLVVGISGTPTKVAAGENHSCIASSNGNAQCWGYNTTGALGNGSSTHSAIATLVKSPSGTGNLTGVSSVSAGQNFSCALVSGSVYCWGVNDKGTLGNASATQSNLPVQVLGAGGTGTLSEVTQLSSNGVASCARKSDGTVWCWGDALSGQLGSNRDRFYLGSTSTLCSNGWCSFAWYPMQMQQSGEFVR